MADPIATAQAPKATPRLIDSASLFEGEVELVIVHNCTPYRLRITRQDKLILTK